MNLIISSRAKQDIVEIWSYNARSYGVNHADRYVSFIYTEIEKLKDNYLIGKEIPEISGFRSIRLRYRSRGHGHIAIYEVVDIQIIVSRVLHTAQDWEKIDFS